MKRTCVLLGIVVLSGLLLAQSKDDPLVPPHRKLTKDQLPAPSHDETVGERFARTKLGHLDGEDTLPKLKGPQLVALRQDEKKEKPPEKKDEKKAPLIPAPKEETALALVMNVQMIPPKEPNLADGATVLKMDRASITVLEVLQNKDKEFTYIAGARPTVIEVPPGTLVSNLVSKKKIHVLQIEPYSVCALSFTGSKLMRISQLTETPPPPKDDESKDKSGIKEKGKEESKDKK